MNYEASLLGWNNGATSEGGVDIQGGSLGTRWGIHDDSTNIVESTPVAFETVDVDLIIDRLAGWVIPREGKVLDDSPIRGINGFWNGT